MPKAIRARSTLTVKLRNITRTDNRPSSIKPMATADVALTRRSLYHISTATVSWGRLPEKGMLVSGRFFTDVGGIMRRLWMQTLIALAVMFLSVGASFAQIERLHGTAAETQAVNEMRIRLKAALAKGDLAACKREGDNLARYQLSKEGEALIDADAAAVERRLREVGTAFDQFRQIRDLSSKKAVEKAYGLIRAIAVKMANDAVTEVGVTLVTAPIPGAGRAVVEMGKQAADFLGNFSDAGQLVNRAQALRSLEDMARYADDQMKTLTPAVREARDTRDLLSKCRGQYQAGVTMEQTPTAVKNAEMGWVLKNVRRDNRVEHTTDYLTRRNQANFQSTLEEGSLGYSNATPGHAVSQTMKWSLPPHFTKPGLVTLTSEALLKATPTTPTLDAGVEIFYFPYAEDPRVIGYSSEQDERVILSSLKPIIVRGVRSNKKILEEVVLCCQDRIGRSLPRGVISNYKAGLNFPPGVAGKQVRVFLYAYAGSTSIMSDEILLGFGHNSIFEYTYEWAERK